MWRKDWLLKHEDKYSNEERQLGLFWKCVNVNSLKYLMN
jgi:hypothetical protein